MLPPLVAATGLMAAVDFGGVEAVAEGPVGDFAVGVREAATVAAGAASGVTVARVVETEGVLSTVAGLVADRPFSPLGGGVDLSGFSREREVHEEQRVKR